MRGELRKALGDQLEVIIKARKDGGGPCSDFVLGPEAFVRYSNLERELYIGGVYVSRFLKEPTYNLRDPTAFLELLLQRWTKELESYTSPDNNVAKSTDTAITTAEQDVLELVTTASVYLCKVRESLCDKLASWGYMPRSVMFLDRVLEMNLTGTPLLSVIRLLHVASDRMANVEALALVGHSDGRAGVVDFTLKAIGGADSLHPDSAFMIEFLKKTYRVALGDLKKARPQQGFADGFPQQHQQPSFIAMAPSPAPGEGPVRKKVSVGDDPLAAMMMAQSAPQQQQSPQPQIQQPQQTQTAMGGFATRSQQMYGSQQQQGPGSHPSSSQQSAYGNRPQTLYTPPQQQQQYGRPQQQQQQYGVQSTSGSYAGRSAAMPHGQQPQAYGQPPPPQQQQPQATSGSFASRSAALSQSQSPQQQYGHSPQQPQSNSGSYASRSATLSYGQPQQQQGQFSNQAASYGSQSSTSQMPYGAQRTQHSHPTQQKQQQYAVPQQNYAPNQNYGVSGQSSQSSYGECQRCSIRSTASASSARYGARNAVGPKHRWNAIATSAAAAAIECAHESR